MDITAYDDETVLLSRLTATGRVDASVGSGSLLVLIEHSRIAAAGATVSAGAGATVGVAMSQLAGGPVTGSVVCSGTWDETWIFRANLCP